MLMTVYKNADDFLMENRAVMEQYSIQANLIWANATSHKTVEEGFFGMSIVKGTSIYLAIQTTPHPMVHFSVGDDIKDMAEILAKYLSANNMLPNKISGKKETVNIFKDIANKLGAKYIENVYLHLMKCIQVNEINITCGKYQSPIAIDFDFGPWFVGFCRDCELDAPIDNATSKSKKMVDSGKLVCYVVNDLPVSMAAKKRKLLGGQGVGFVYTPPEQSGNGYSTACIKHLTHEILDEGNDSAFLFVNKINPAAVRVYEKVGYQKIEDFIEYKIKT